MSEYARTAKKIDTWDFVPDDVHDRDKRVTAEVFMEKSHARNAGIAEPIKVYAKVTQGQSTWNTERFDSPEALHEHIRKFAVESSSYPWEKIVVVLVLGGRFDRLHEPFRHGVVGHDRNNLDVRYELGYRATVGRVTYYTHHDPRVRHENYGAPIFHHFKSLVGSQEGGVVYLWTQELEDNLKGVMEKMDLLRERLRFLNGQGAFPRLGKPEYPLLEG
jgi:hypothetical protein